MKILDLYLFCTTHLIFCRTLSPLTPFPLSFPVSFFSLLLHFCFHHTPMTSTFPSLLNFLLSLSLIQPFMLPFLFLSLSLLYPPASLVSTSTTQASLLFISSHFALRLLLAVFFPYTPLTFHPSFTPPL